MNFTLITYLSVYDILPFVLLSMLQLTIDIGHEVKYQNKMLGEMVSLAFSVTGKFVLDCRYSVVFSVIMLKTLLSRAEMALKF